MASSVRGRNPVAILAQRRVGFGHAPRVRHLADHRRRAGARRVSLHPAIGRSRRPPARRRPRALVVPAHELYNAGHLYEAAVAHVEATGKRTLLDVAIRNADLICRIFGPGERLETSGHQEIERALVKLYRVTGDRKHLDQARFFLDQRGREHSVGPVQFEAGNRFFMYNDLAYRQDHAPILEQPRAVGHAVRASYMFIGATDVAALTSDAAYGRKADAFWTDVTSKRIYVTGGLGSDGRTEAPVGAGFSRPDPPDAEPELRLDGEPIPFELDRGFAVIRRRWQQGDRVELTLPMPVRRIVASESVEEDRGKAAIARRSVIYALEAIDNGGRVTDLRVPLDARLEAVFRADLLGGVEIVTGSAVVTSEAGRTAERPFLAVPYFAWGNRGPGEMGVWIPW